MQVSKSSNNAEFTTSNILIWFSVVIIFITYNLPWLTSTGTGLTFGAFDLTEWVSLHPDVIRMSPALLTPLLLRLIPVYLIGMVTIQFPPRQRWSRTWWIAMLFTVLIAIALLPPLEIITSEQGNINYRQMAMVSALALIVGVIGLSGQLYRWRQWITLGIAILGIVSSISGFVMSIDLYAWFFLPRSIGIGLILTIGGFLIIMIICILQIRKRGIAS